MNKEKLVTEEDIESAEVRLKPHFGLSPGRWLAAVGAVALSLVLFLVFFLPGLLHPGTVYRFFSIPSGAAVFVDTGYVGTTPCEVFLTKGDHDIRIRRPGFSDADVSRKVPGHVFATILFPRKESVQTKHSLLDGEGIWKAAVAEFSAWNLAGEPSSVWQAPTVLESAARARFADPAAPQPSWEERRDFLLAAARVVTHPAAAKELVRAAEIVFGSGIADSSAVAEGWKKIFQDTPALAAMLREFLPEAAGALPGAGDAQALSAATPACAPSRDSARTVGPVRFIPVAVDDRTAFYLAETETTVGQYDAFLRENPRWSAENRDKLIAEGLVTEEYLEGHDASPPDVPARGVSWYAAMAFAEWMDRKAPPGYTVSLPSENEWGQAARAGGGTGSQIWSDGVRAAPAAPENRRRDEAGFADLLGNLWEWCEDSYAAYPEIGRTAALRFPGSERSVRGGCWANARGTVQETTRGSFPPKWCSAFLGFRVALTAEPR